MAVHDWTRVEAGIFHMEYYRRKHKGALRSMRRFLAEAGFTP